MGGGAQLTSPPPMFIFLLNNYGFYGFPLYSFPLTSFFSKNQQKLFFTLAWEQTKNIWWVGRLFNKQKILWIFIDLTSSSSSTSIPESSSSSSSPLFLFPALTGGSETSGSTRSRTSAPGTCSNTSPSPNPFLFITTTASVGRPRSFLCRSSGFVVLKYRTVGCCLLYCLYIEKTDLHFKNFQQNNFRNIRDKIKERKRGGTAIRSF